MTIVLPDEIESRLKAAASQHGLDAAGYARKLIVEHLPGSTGGSLSDLFQQWGREDSTTDPVEIARRNTEVEEFKAAMNRNRAEMEGPDARRWQEIR